MAVIKLEQCVTPAIMLNVVPAISHLSHRFRLHYKPNKLMIVPKEFICPGARFSKVPVTFRVRNQIFRSKYKE